MSDQSGELLGSLGHLSELPPSFSAKPLAAAMLPRPRLWGSPAPWAQLILGSRNTSCYPHPSSSSDGDSFLFASLQCPSTSRLLPKAAPPLHKECLW